MQYKLDFGKIFCRTFSAVVATSQILQKLRRILWLCSVDDYKDYKPDDYWRKVPEFRQTLMASRVVTEIVPYWCQGTIILNSQALSFDIKIKLIKRNNNDLTKSLRARALTYYHVYQYYNNTVPSSNGALTTSRGVL